MMKFAYRLLLFCLLPLPLLLFLDHAVDSGLHKSRYLYYGDWNDLSNGIINADMLVLGTSRAYVHVSPSILDSVLRLNSYNLGLDGASFDIQFAILKLYLQHNKKPKYILQEAGYPTFVRSDSTQYLHEFLSYLDDTSIWNLVRRNYKSVGLADRYFPLYKYGNELPLMREGLLSYTGHGSKDVKYKGYEGRDYLWDNSFNVFKKDHPNGIHIPIDPEMVKQFSAFLQFCADSDIKVIVFYAPTYFQSKPYILNYNEIHNMISGCAAAYNVPFLDYMSDTMNNNREWFYNTQHLNKKGAELFTSKMAFDVKKIINDRPVH